MTFFLVAQLKDHDWLAVRFADGDASFQGTYHDAFQWVQEHASAPDSPMAKMAEVMRQKASAERQTVDGQKP